MKRGIVLSLLVAFMVSIAIPAIAQYSSTPRQTTMGTNQSTASSPAPVAFSLFDPVQWPARSRSVTGVRFNVIYANHRNLTGVDLGLFLPVNRLTGDLSGIQFGLYNGVGGDGGGIQFGTVNYVRGNFTGLQYGAGNVTRGKVNGVQIGFYNQASSVSGLQFGALNVTDSLYGVQIGLGNLKNEPGESFPGSGPRFLPIFNWSF